MLPSTLPFTREEGLLNKGKVVSKKKKLISSAPKGGKSKKILPRFNHLKEEENI